MSAPAGVSRQAAELAHDLQTLIDRHEAFPEIYGEADELTELQAVLWDIGLAFGARGTEGEPF